ncbi:hypothetical protein I4U23_014465 [Adineta vaga]|nr:hypothetical protein I4U23_014465 [Adineta vaga]
MLNIVLISFIIFLTGPILSLNSIKSDLVSSDLPSVGSIILIGLIDAVLYGISLYFSIQTKIESQSNLNDERQFLQPISETLELILRTQTDLFDLIKDINKDNTTDQILIRNSRNKLTTYEFIQNDGLMEITKNISERLQFLKMNSFFNVDLFDRIYYYLFTSSFLLYIHQFILWIFQYLSRINPTKYLTYSFILSFVVLCQSSGLIYFLQMTRLVHLLSPISLYTFVIFIRSLINIHHYSFYT